VWKEVTNVLSIGAGSFLLCGIVVMDLLAAFIEPVQNMVSGLGMICSSMVWPIMHALLGFYLVYVLPSVKVVCNHS